MRTMSASILVMRSSCAPKRCSSAPNRVSMRGEPRFHGAEALLEGAKAKLQIADLGGQGRDPGTQQFETDFVLAHRAAPAAGSILSSYTALVPVVN